MKSLCVFCGSATGSRPEYAEVARALAAGLLQRGIGLVYGGGSVGLMGVLADAVLRGGGEAVGVIPRALASRELAHAGLTRLHLVDSMHERKARMAALADGFVALPGGLGTLEETLEILTWSQLGIHRKPVGVLNVAGYYDPLLALLRQGVHEGFVPRESLSLLLFAATPDELLEQITRWEAPGHRRVWLAPEQI